MNDLRKNIELNILRSAVDNPQRMDILLDYTPDIFEDEFYRKVFEIFIKLDSENKTVDAPALYAALPQYGISPEATKNFILEFSSTIGSLQIIDLINSIIHQNNLEKVRCMAVDFMNGFNKKNITLDEIKERIDFINHEIDAANGASHDLHIQDVNNSPMNEIFLHTDYLNYGIPELDKKMYGIFNGQLIIIASRPGLGKSTLAMQIAQNQKGTVFFVSREMKIKKLYARNLSYFSEVESWKIEFDRCTVIEKEKVNRAREKIKEMELDIIYNDKLKDYKKILRHAKKIQGLKLLIIDYLQLLKGAESDRRHEFIGEMTSELKDFANTQNIPILLLSQLNRGIEFSDREPELSDLKESGAIEQDADVVLFIWQKKGNTKDQDEMYFKIAKNRDGRSDIKIKTYFEKKFYKFGLNPNEAQEEFNFEDETKWTLKD
jgi:replicative DNA helicase